MHDQPDLPHELDEVLNATYDRVMRVESQLRRFARAMVDIGAPVPADWATQDGDVVDFKALTPKQFDRLICLVEDIAARRPIHVTIMRGGPTLFDPGVPAGPVVQPAQASVHMQVPR
jgi:hypothetical protein